MIQGVMMTDPITTMAASAIASLAFQEFIKSGTGELAKKFTGDAIAKTKQLRELIWNRLTGKYPTADVALEQAKAGEQAGIDIVAALLEDEMQDEAFAEQVRAIANEITLIQIEDNSIMRQFNYGGKNYQTKTGPNNTNFFGGEHQHGQR
jgi:hypothetical protein